MEGGLLLCFLALGLLATAFTTIEGTEIGVNYGMNGNNLPSPDQVVALVKSKNIGKLRLFQPDANALNALKNSGIAVVLGTLKDDLSRLASDSSFAASWVSANVAPYSSSVTFRYIFAGNEEIPGDLAASVLPAMQNLESALKSAGIAVPVTTVVSTRVIGVSYPPSQGAFSQDAASVMAPIISFLAARNTPLLVNVYPYFAYNNDPANVRLDYALFEANGVVVQDGSLGYTNLFDAILDSVYAALEKAGGEGVEVVVSETGWPSAGGATGATVDNAKAYNNNVVAHVNSGSGTPRRPGKAVETYIFEMFNENQKPEGTEQNYGLYQPDMTEVYPMNF